jgi:hypothetical protein
MAWSSSKTFRQFSADQATNTAAFALTTDTIKMALFNNTPTPDQNVTAANSAYNVSQWVTAQEVWQAVQWPQAGVALTSKVVSVATAGKVVFDAADVASGTTATLASVFGALVYDDTLTTPVADQGIGFTYFGGSNGVTGGQFTIQLDPSGLIIWTL